MRARSCSGLSATTIWMVEQFGLAMMPRCRARSRGFTSGTTSGQAGSIRHAELLSMTTAPWRTAMGASFRLTSSLVANRAMSIPLKASSVASWVYRALPLKFTGMPAMAPCSSRRSSPTGKLYSSRI